MFLLLYYYTYSSALLQEKVFKIYNKILSNCTALFVKQAVKARKLIMNKTKAERLIRKYLLHPPTCMYCQSEQCKPYLPLCKHCFSKYLKTLFERCDNCGALPINCQCFTVKNCAAYYWLFNYKTRETKRLLNRLKHVRDVHAFAFLGSRLADAVNTKTAEALPYDCVCYVPRNPKAKRLYNHDHAEELAKNVARYLGLPCAPLIKHTGTRGEQKRLSREYRGDAARTRFEINEALLFNGKLTCKTPLLVDDIVTTGSTAAECARLLKEHGAKYVGLAFIAHTPKRGSID